MTACDAIAGLYVGAHERLVCLAAPWFSELASWIALLVAVVGIIWVLGRRYYLDARAEGRARPRWLDASVLLVPLAALAAAIAAGEPAMIATTTGTDEHLIIVVDQSASARRLGEERAARLDAIARFVTEQEAAATVPLSVSVLSFGGRVVLRMDHGRAADAAALLRADGTGPEVDFQQSAVLAALEEAGRLAAAQPDADAIVLLSDGNDTVDDLLAAVGGGVLESLPATYVVPVSAGPPAEGIVSAYLPPAVESNATPIARVVFDPGADEPVTGWSIAASRNGQALAVSQPTLDGAIQQLRLPITFEGRGLQFAQVGFAAGTSAYSRRMVTLVKSPIRVLGLGDAGFLDVLPSDRFDVTAAATLPLSLADFDVVVLGAVDAGQLSRPDLQSLRDAVQASGLGLLLVNGGLRGDVREPTVTMSYKDTPLDAILPVSADPRFLIEDPPPRDILVVVDTSGSMEGSGIDSAKRAIRDLVSEMRPVDRIDVITFTAQQSGWLNGDAAGKSRLESFLAAMGTGGGSDAGPAFAEAARQTGNYAAAFFISDGDLADMNFRQNGMRFIYLEVGVTNALRHPEIAAIADEAQVLLPGQGLQLTPKFLKPEERTEYFLPDRVSPVTVQAIEGISGGVATSGLALAYVRADAERVLINPTGGEPVLAFRDAGGIGGGRTAAFLSSFSGDWTGTEPGRRGIERSIEELASWSLRDRFDIRATDLGSALALRVSVLPGKGRDAIPELLTATLVSQASAVASVPLVAVADAPGVFEGSLGLPVIDRQPKWEGALVLEEDDGSRQIIPVTLPTAAPGNDNGREAASAYLEQAALEGIAEASGGAYDRLPASDGSPAGSQPPARLHLYFLAAAAILFGLGMWGREIRL